MAIGLRASLLMLLAASGCSAEQRVLVPERPTSPPTGPADPRIAAIQDNFYEIAQGGRYFTWFGCTRCHGGPKVGWPALRRFDHYYAAIGHQGYDRRLPAEQRWQIAAYVHSLPTIDPAKRHRQAVDQQGEAQATAWRGPL